MSIIHRSSKTTPKQTKDYFSSSSCITPAITSQNGRCQSEGNISYVGNRCNKSCNKWQSTKSFYTKANNAGGGKSNSSNIIDNNNSSSIKENCRRNSSIENSNSNIICSNNGSITITQETTTDAAAARKSSKTSSTATATSSSTSSTTILFTKYLVWTIVFGFLFISSTAAFDLKQKLKLNASQAFDNTWSTATDLENELECVSSQQKRSAKNPSSSSSSSNSNSNSGAGGWTNWSEWSTCSRTCDGGVMQQLRRCQNANGCKGDSVRFRICNMQPCPDKIDFRAQQCSSYNDVPYDGALYKWTPHYDYVEPCALTCRGRPAHLNDDMSHEAPTGEEHYDELTVVVQLSPRVLDGTRCRSGSLDMCIQGKCQRVGCDLKIGSGKKVDACGVCGGDGSSCSQSLFQWETAPMSLCSVSCGGGYKMSHILCRNRVTGAEVEDAFCNAANRPEPNVELCNTHTCPPSWITDEWGECSHLCGPGIRHRLVVCAEENNGLKTRVADGMCSSSPKPPVQENCILEHCPIWEADDWSGCSVSCGQGIQLREVECKSEDGRHSAKCDPNFKPESAKQCSTGIPCAGGGTIILGRTGARGIIEDEQEDDDEEDSHDMEHGHDDEDDGIVENDDDDDDDGGGGDHVNHGHMPRNHNIPHSHRVENADVGDTDEDEEENDSDDDENDEDVYNDQPSLAKYAHHTVSRLHHEENEGPRTMRLTSGGYSSRDQNLEADFHSSEPTFIKDLDWSPCSVTCGEGIRRRTYRCKIFLEYSRTIATVNDSLCEGPKPHDEVERCVEEPCMLPSHGYEDQYPRDAIKVGVSEPGKTYVWREQGYTSCSASCLGGVEELIINCVREDNGRVVSPFLCAPETKPEARVRTCNDRPCPPRWNYSDYTPCSKSCGIGIKTREVQCIHEVTRGGENTMVVPNSMCPQPPPADRQYCNVLDCPVRWEVGEWSKCSHTCGYGIKSRKVECKQIMAQEHKIERPETMCPSAKPPDKKPCNVKPCPPEDPKPVIQISNTTHIQHDPKKSKITLKIGGAGVVFFGTQVKIKCPVKRYNRTKIKWSKDHKPLQKSRKFKVSKKGALRILDITFRDAGIYSCHAGLSSAEITIDVKAKPGQRQEDLERQESERLVRERSGTEPLTAADMTAADNSTQNTRRKQQQLQNSKDRNGNRRKTDGVQHHADSSIMGDEHSQLVQQAQDGLPQPSASSGGSRRTNTLLAMPYFQALLSNLQYLWPSFQKFSNSRGHHMLVDRGLQYGVDFDQKHHYTQEDEPADLTKGSHLKPQIETKDLTLGSTGSSAAGARADGDTNENNTEDINNNARNDANAIVDDTLENGQPEQAHSPYARWANHWTDTHLQMTAQNPTVTYQWLTSEWTECSQKCGNGVSGLKSRSVTCIRVTRHVKAIGIEPTESNEMVENAHCEDFGLDIPETFETCGNEECPLWTKTEWSNCQQSKCHGRNTALQRRDVSCRYPNNTLSKSCADYERPVAKQECYNERCKGVWRVEPWSECNAPCGRQGIKYRILQCVWYGTRRPAGNACKHQPRPAVMKVCKSLPCYAKAMHHCKDTSRYCRNARTMGLCRLHRYQEKCCKSCKYQQQQQQQQPEEQEHEQQQQQQQYNVSN